MPIDPQIQAAPLVTDSREISPVQWQNRYGARHLTIPDLQSGKHITILAIQTPEAFSSSTFFEVLQLLEERYGVEAMQTAFAAVVPGFGDLYRNDLYLSAHLRTEQIRDDRTDASDE